jgi:DNA-binding winged helix-turn-helix (wHTH) protein
VTSASQISYRFGDFVVDTRSFRLLRAAAAIPIEPKALELLIFLLANRNRLVTKAELLDSVWRGVFVTESALTREIALLRRLLGDDSKEPRYIETVARHGYRFVAPVVEISGNAAAAADLVPAPTRKNSRRSAVAVAACLVLLAMTVLMIARSHKATAAGRLPALGSSQLTFSAGLDAYASFSPDGNAIAYSSDKSGVFQIHIRRLAPAGDDVQITSDYRQNLQPAWSPDGRWIACHSGAEDGIWLMPALGGAARRLTEFGSRPAWSRDSSRLAFQSRDQGVIAEGELGGRKESSIWTFSLGDGKLKQVTVPDQPHSASIFGHSTPAWSPDRHWIAFSAGSGIWCVQPDTGAIATVFETGATGLIYDPVFSADGARIFYGTTTGEMSAVWSVAVGPGCRPTAPPRQVFPVGPHRPRYLAASLDGRLLAPSSAPPAIFIHFRYRLARPRRLLGLRP